jgi:hypothetical protein
MERVIRIDPEFPEIRELRENLLEAKKQKEQLDAPAPPVAQ